MTIHATFTWTDASIETLRQRWSEGKTGTEIGDELGISRNSVIGKASRLQLEKRGSGKNPIRHRLRKPRPSRAKRPATASAPQARPIQPKLPQVAPAPVRSNPTLIMKLKDCMCRYPLWGDERPQADVSTYCGAATDVGRPYCAAHVRVVTAPARVREAA